MKKRKWKTRKWRRKKIKLKWIKNNNNNNSEEGEEKQRIYKREIKIKPKIFKLIGYTEKEYAKRIPTENFIQNSKNIKTIYYN